MNFLPKLHNFLQTTHKVLRQTVNFPPITHHFLQTIHNFLQTIHNFLQTIHKVLRQTVNTPTTTHNFRPIIPPAVRILIHDAVRPGVSRSLIGRVCAALRSHAVANVVLPVVDTLIEVDADGRMRRVPDRALLRRVQTPQGFHAPVLFEAYRRALADPNFRATDDCSVVFRYCPEIDIALVPGEERNLKLTYPEDLTVLAHYLTQPLP